MYYTSFMFEDGAFHHLVSFEAPLMPGGVAAAE